LVIFHGFRRLIDAIQASADALDALVRYQQELGPALDRLDALERGRHQFEAECEGMLLKADGKLKAAASAEQRERQLRKSQERLTDSFDLEGLEATESRPLVPADDVAPSEAQGLPPLRLALATNDKTHAVKAKWGVA